MTDTYILPKQTTRLTGVDVFVEDDCLTEARAIVGHGGHFVVCIDVVTFYGDAETLERVLAEALEAVRVAAQRRRMTVTWHPDAVARALAQLAELRAAGNDGSPVHEALSIAIDALRPVVGA